MFVIFNNDLYPVLHNTKIVDLHVCYQKKDYCSYWLFKIKND